MTACIIPNLHAASRRCLESHDYMLLMLHACYSAHRCTAHLEHGHISCQMVDPVSTSTLVCPNLSHCAVLRYLACSSCHRLQQHCTCSVCNHPMIACMTLAPVKHAQQTFQNMAVQSCCCCCLPACLCCLPSANWTCAAKAVWCTSTSTSCSQKNNMGNCEATLMSMLLYTPFPWPLHRVGPAIYVGTCTVAQRVCKCP